MLNTCSGKRELATTARNALNHTLQKLKRAENVEI
jgi:hypothetical protein